MPVHTSILTVLAMLVFFAPASAATAERAIKQNTLYLAYCEHGKCSEGFTVSRWMSKLQDCTGFCDWHYQYRGLPAWFPKLSPLMFEAIGQAKGTGRFIFRSPSDQPNWLSQCSSFLPEEAKSDRLAIRPSESAYYNPANRQKALAQLSDCPLIVAGVSLPVYYWWMLHAQGNWPAALFGFLLGGFLLTAVAWFGFLKWINRGAFEVAKNRPPGLS